MTIRSSPFFLPMTRMRLNQGTVRRPVSQPRFKAHHPVGRWSRMPSTKFSGAWLWYSWVVVGVACYYRFIVDSLLLVGEMVFSILFLITKLGSIFVVAVVVVVYCLRIHLVVLGSGGNPLLTYEIITKCTKHEV